MKYTISDGSIVNVPSKPINTLALHEQQLLANSKAPFTHINYIPLDIIDLYVKFKGKYYSQATVEIYKHITRNKVLYQQSQTRAQTLVQEKVPVVINPPQLIDFTDSFAGECKVYEYRNEDGNIIGFNVSYTILSWFEGVGPQNVLMFYTFWRFKNSPHLYLLPKAPEPPYMIYNVASVINAGKILVATMKVR